MQGFIVGVLELLFALVFYWYTARIDRRKLAGGRSNSGVFWVRNQILFYAARRLLGAAVIIFGLSIILWPTRLAALIKTEIVLSVAIAANVAVLGLCAWHCYKLFRE